MRRVVTGALALVLAWSAPARAADWQRAAQTALGARAGCVVVLDPDTGEILAMVNPKMAVGEAFPLGSVAKLVTSLAALQLGLVNGASRFECQGARGDWPCWQVHRRLDLEGAIAHSCSAALAQVGQELGGARMEKALALAGFGRPTGCDVAGESAGSLEPVHGREATGRLACGDSNSLMVTPVQVAVLVAAIANGGTRYRPHQRPGPAREIGRLPWPAGLAVVRAGMRRSVLEGTSRSAQVPTCAVFGKTGTAPWRTDASRRHGWFAGYAPGCALVVFVRQGDGFGGAAPIAGRLLRQVAS